MPASTRWRAPCPGRTHPSGLVKATWEDRFAAVRIGVRHVRGRIPPRDPLVARRLLE